MRRPRLCEQFGVEDIELVKGMVLTYVMREIGFLGEFLKTKLCHSTLITCEIEMTGDIYDVLNTFNFHSLEEKF